MASYPNTTYDEASRVTPRDSIAMDVASDGSIRSVVNTTGEVYDVTLVHAYLSESDAATIESFYASNRTASVDVSWRGVTFACRFTGKPTVDPAGGTYWKVTSKLIGRKSDGS